MKFYFEHAVICNLIFLSRFMARFATSFTDTKRKCNSGRLSLGFWVTEKWNGDYKFISEVNDKNYAQIYKE